MWEITKKISVFHIISVLHGFPGATESVGKHMLEACNNNLEMAVTMFLDGGGIAEEPSTSASSAGASSSRHPPTEWVTPDVPVLSSNIKSPLCLPCIIMTFINKHCSVIQCMFPFLAEMMCEHLFLRSKIFWWSPNPCLEVIQCSFFNVVSCS